MVRVSWLGYNMLAALNCLCSKYLRLKLHPNAIPPKLVSDPSEHWTGTGRMTGNQCTGWGYTQVVTLLKLKGHLFLATYISHTIPQCKIWCYSNFIGWMGMKGLTKQHLADVLAFFLMAYQYKRNRSRRFQIPHLMVSLQPKFAFDLCISINIFCFAH